MNGTTVRKLARDLNLRVVDLIAQLQAAGAEIATEDDLVTGNQQLLLLKQTRSAEKKERDITLDDLHTAQDLETLNNRLTKAMADRTIQALIKDENLDTIADAILARAANEAQPLLAAAALGRLAAVARSPARAASIFERADQVLPDEPPSLLTLPDTDGKQKQYAAQMLARVSAVWVAEYRYREALAIDTADNARRELLAANLTHEGNIANWLAAVTRHASDLRGIDNAETRLKRVRRIFGSMRDVTDRWRDDVGSDPGPRLADCLKAYLTGKLVELEQVVLIETVDHLLGILNRIIQLRFSTALYADTYAVLDQGKRTLGPGLWVRFLSQSAAIPELRIALLESSLVLARQNRTDKQIMAVLVASYSSRPQVAAAVKRHFEDARDLDPDVAEWWRSAGDVSETRRHVEHKVGNTEDAQIGALLIEVESNREAMRQVGGSVVDYLTISEPVLASTVKRAADGYESIAQIARRLARMRKLSKTDIKGARLEYNSIEHEMLGGHRAGVRRVRVVRDGIQKDFGGKIRTLVKPWVEPESD